MGSILVTILDPIRCRISSEAANSLKPIMSYKTEWYKPGQYAKIRGESTKEITERANGQCFFWTGLLPRVKDYCAKRGWTLYIQGMYGEYAFDVPSLPGIELKGYQVDLINKACQNQRGIIQAPTGSGKTVIGISIVKAFRDPDVLWLCHTKDLMYQTGEEFKKYGYKPGYLGDSHCDLGSRILIAMRQSAVKFLDSPDVKEQTMVIVDEAHHISKFNGEYAEILSHVLSPLRFGLTATLPTSDESKLAVESFLGPLVGRITINEAKEEGMSSDIKIKILKVFKNQKVKEQKRYPDVYRMGVIENDEKNLMLMERAKQHVDKGDSVLIIVKEIEHGDTLLSTARSLGLEARFVHGATNGEFRVKLKDALNDKRIKCVISSVVWKEGINIPELNVIINAAGGKSEIATLQTIGRGLRKTETKESILVYDVFDPSHYHLINHFGERVSLYSEMGWL